ncbi:MAG: hypothetical protein HZB37_03590 [Planctomycetes bacterium]|nr:hypothetical protein [Planctomycetota bacterium]
MKILYDHQIFVYQEFGGFSRYFYELKWHYFIVTDELRDKAIRELDN